MEHHITFECFQELNKKDGALTTGDVFARQLMRIRGISAEKVFEIKPFSHSSSL